MVETTTKPAEPPRSGLKRPIYLDYQATTPLDPRVLEAMTPYLTEKFGNPHSTAHRYGWEAEAGVDRARAQIAGIIGAEPDDIVFTSGATESNNLTIKGLARSYGAKRDHIVTVATEHKCVLESCRRLEREGFKVTYLGVDTDGLIDLDALRATLGERTLLVSVMAANNEIGVIQPLAEIGAMCREHRVLFHTDAAQGVGKMPLDVDAMNIDLMSISGHKIYGPKGIGALYIRNRGRIRPTPLFDGGGQEGGLRPGTLPTPLCVGLGEACRLAGEEMEDERARLRAMATDFVTRVQKALPGVRLNGHSEQRIPGNINLSFPGVDGDLLLAELRELALSSGAACASASDEPSYVLSALGLGEDDIRSSLRIGLGRMTRPEDMDHAANLIIDRVRRLKASS